MHVPVEKNAQFRIWPEMARQLLAMFEAMKEGQLACDYLIVSDVCLVNGTAKKKPEGVLGAIIFDREKQTVRLMGKHMVQRSSCNHFFESLASKMGIESLPHEQIRGKRMIALCDDDAALEKLVIEKRRVTFFHPSDVWGEQPAAMCKTVHNFARRYAGQTSMLACGESSELLLSHDELKAMASAHYAQHPDLTVRTVQPEKPYHFNIPAENARNTLQLMGKMGTKTFPWRYVVASDAGIFDARRPVIATGSAVVVDGQQQTLRLVGSQLPKASAAKDIARFEYQAACMGMRALGGEKPGTLLLCDNYHTFVPLQNKYGDLTHIKVPAHTADDVRQNCVKLHHINHLHVGALCRIGTQQCADRQFTRDELELLAQGKKGSAHAR